MTRTWHKWSPNIRIFYVWNRIEYIPYQMVDVRAHGGLGPFSVMLGIGEYSGRLSMVMRSSGHISLEPTLEGPEYVLHCRLRLQWPLQGERKEQRS
jgi:hypothetical protein